MVGKIPDFLENSKLTNNVNFFALKCHFDAEMV